MAINFPFTMDRARPVWDRVIERGHPLAHKTLEVLRSAGKLNEDAATPLAWRCVFLGCDALRIWEGGRPSQFSHLDTCPRCDSRIAVTCADRRDALATAVSLDL